MRRLLLLMLGMLLISAQLLAQNRTITGKVTDEAGNPIANASIVIKGTKVGTTAGPDGTFSLVVPADAKTLVVSSVNYASQEVALGKTTTYVNPQLKAAEGSMSEVVIVGYGSQKKSDVTSSVSKVSGDKVANVPLSSVDQILQGKAAGLQSTTFSGQPGANQQIRIRGVGSYSLSSQPLFVLDGIILNSGDLSRLTTTTNVLAQLNPNDIESISVLKDAGATAIYGSLGSNGVIVITTKKGRAGKTKFNITSESGFNKHGDIPAAGMPLRTPDWIKLFKEAYLNAGGTQAQADAAAATYGDGSVNTDWLNLLTRTGTQQQYNFSASGGDEKTKFYISGGYFKQQANVIGSDLKRISSVMNFDHTVSKKIGFSVSIQPTYSRENAPLSNSSAFSNPVMEFYFARPTQNPYNADGSLNITKSAKDFAGTYNPLYIIAHDLHYLDYVTLNGKVEGRYNILKNLTFTSRMGLQYLNLEEYYYNNPLHGDGAGVNGRGYSYYTRYFLYDWVNQAEYRTEFLSDKSLHLNLLLGNEAITSKQYLISAQAQNFPTPSLIASATAATPTIANNNFSDYAFLAQFGRATLDYQNKYVLQGSLRRDGSSRFSQNNEFGYFPSVSVSWNVSREDFFNSVSNVVNDFKIRGSYGVTGNANGLSNYGWRQTYGYGFNYNGAPGGGFNTVGNADLQWEAGKQTDVGFDASFLKNRLSVTFDWYNRKIDKLIFPFQPSLTIGFSTINKNIGAFENKGQELTINATPISTKDFTWDVSFNISHNVNRVTAIPPGQTFLTNGSFIIKPGHDFYEFYMRQWAGVDPANGNPLWYTDSSRKATTSVYNSAALVATGKQADPKYFGGFSNSFKYKGFTLDADFYYNYGNYVQDQWAYYLTDEINPSYGKYGYTLQRWQKPGDITNVPKLVYGSTNSSARGSTRFLYKGDFIRLRNIAVGYNLSSEVVSRLHLSAVNIYVRGTNLWTHVYDKNIPFDPEQGISSQSNLNLFYNKSVTVGLNVNF